MRNGIYRIEVSWPDTKSCGVATIKGEALRGIDRDCAYIGECSKTDGVPMLSLRRVQLAEPILDANSSQPVKLLGQADEEGFLLAHETAPTSISMHGKWIAEA